MLFNSLQFFIFFPVVTGLYFFLPHRRRWLLLLIASCIFYMAFIPAYILILFATIIVDYFAGLYIEKAQGKKRRLLLIVSLISNLGFLAFFKYYAFIGGNVAGLLQLLHWNYSLPALSIILPIGLSFHTFQAMSYTIEVFRGNQRAERHFGIYALYVMFYPQLVAGPIERPQNLIHQFKEVHYFERARVISGLKQMLWGFFKKIVIADRAALLVDSVYNNPAGHSGLPLIIATILFAFQIYYDFSGYSDIAIGAARVMGFKLMDNFNRPYAALSVQDFWRRWHISLSTWFKDYVYIPLGGSRVGRTRHYFNLFVVFLLSGLWHGAAWTFVIWGALHGAYVVVSTASKVWRAKIVSLARLARVPKFHQTLKTAFTFCLVTFAWIFFRANTLSDARYIISHSLTGLAATFSSLGALVHSLPEFNKTSLLLAALPIVALEILPFLSNYKSISNFYNGKRWPKWAAYSFLLGWMLAFGVFTKQNFIYFQF